jgi:hypothetical protein
MNISTFQDAINSRRRALADEIEDDGDEEEVEEVSVSRKKTFIEGEEEDGHEKVKKLILKS